MVHGFLGGLIGILSGLIMGLIIWGILQITVTDTLGVHFGPPREMILFLSMGIGALIGAFSGIQVAFREKK